MSKANKPRTKAQVLKELETTKARLARTDKRIERLNTIKARISEVTNTTERNRALLAESINEWIADYREANQGSDTDFESLHVDFLMLDEAQNMKNLWPVGRREGGVPKYLGAIAEGSDRAMAFAIRAFLTQRETGGSGVALLSATPAKNSPLEFFTLLGYVDHYGWTRRNILDPEYFIDRYLRLELRTVLKPDGNVESRTAVVGFKMLNELRDIVFRYGDFKDAKDVGLKLPDSKQDRAFLPMNEEQREKYGKYRSEYESIVTSRNAGKDRHRALAILQKMALVALHPELDDPPLVKSEPGKKPRHQWTWANATRVRNPESPKLRKTVELVLQRPECGHIIFCDNVAIHRWLKGLLVAAGIDGSRIAILNADQAKTPLTRQEIAEGFNGVPAVVNPSTGQIEQEAVAPKYDIVIANAVAYEGIDLQVRTCRVIHLDLPFEPATLQQRNGRAVRQGNLQSVIEILYLLSEKSYDAIKLGLITGKLRWMADILKGADRETNNPAAGMDLSTEDLLLMLADDPEAAKAAMEEVKRRNELERRQQAESRAWQRLSDLLSYMRVVARREDELEKEQGRKQVALALEYLRAVPSDIWPWQFVVDKAMAGVPMTTVSVYVASDGQVEPTVLTSRAVWDGLYLPVAAGRGVYFAVVSGGVVCVRDQGDHRWSRPTSLSKGVGNLLGLTSPDAMAQAEPPDDETQWRSALKSAVQELRWSSSSGISSLRLMHAPDWWREMVWRDFGAAIVERLNAAGFELPARNGDSLVFRSGVTVDSVIPPTDLGWADFLRRVEQGRFSFGDLTDRAKTWWGRDFPRGVADERAIAAVEEADGSIRRVRLASGVNEGFAVADMGTQEELGTRRWKLAHVASGFLIPVDFRNLDAARLGARFLATYPTDGDKILLDPEKLRLLAWIAEQSDLPTLSGVQAKYQQMTSEAR